MPILRLVKQLPTIAGYNFLPGVQFKEVEIINVIKKPWKYAPQLTTVYVDIPGMMTTADTGSPLLAGEKYVFLLQVHNTPDIGWIALYPLSLNNASLAMVREAATNGAE